MFTILPREDLECWRHFVLACRLLCQQRISFTELDLADALLIKFCVRVEQMYGKDVVSPNMHMHGRLGDQNGHSILWITHCAKCSLP